MPYVLGIYETPCKTCNFQSLDGRLEPCKYCIDIRLPLCDDRAFTKYTPKDNKEEE